MMPFPLDTDNPVRLGASDYWVELDDSATHDLGAFRACDVLSAIMLR